MKLIFSVEEFITDPEDPELYNSKHTEVTVILEDTDTSFVTIDAIELSEAAIAAQEKLKMDLTPGHNGMMPIIEAISLDGEEPYQPLPN